MSSSHFHTYYTDKQISSFPCRACLLCDLHFCYLLIILVTIFNTMPGFAGILAIELCTLTYLLPNICFFIYYYADHKRFKNHDHPTLTLYKR